MHFFIKKIRTIDAIHLNVDLSFVVRLRWEQTQIKEALRRHGSTASLQGAVVETDELWMPDFSILNGDNLEIVRTTTPLLNMDTQQVNWVIEYTGTITNDMDLRSFPFDSDWFRILACGGRGDKAHEVLLVPHDPEVHSSIAPWVDKQIPPVVILQRTFVAWAR